MLFFLFALLLSSQLQKKGFVTFHYSPNIYGDEAIALILVATTIGVILLLLSLYLFAKRYLLIRLEKIPNDDDILSKYVICTTCGEPFYGFETIKMRCSKCGSKVIDIKEYYADNSLKMDIKKQEFTEKIQQQ